MIVFDREQFAEDTAGDFGSALDMVETLVGVINKYCDEDESAEMSGDGCFGKHAEVVVMNMLKSRRADDYFAAYTK